MFLNIRIVFFLSSFFSNSLLFTEFYIKPALCQISLFKLKSICSRHLYSAN